MLENQKSLKLQEEHIVQNIQNTIEGFVAEHSSQSLTKVIQYHFQSGGKKLRAKIAYLIALNFNSSSQDAIIWASVCEVLHNASLIHDDLQDQDEFRRGKLAVWKKYDTHTAVTCGDFLIFLSMQMVQNLSLSNKNKIQLLDLLTRTSLKLANGQYNESLLKLHSIDDLWNLYIDMINHKTSALFELPLVGAGLLTSQSSATLKQLHQLAVDFGQLFQVQDDILDLYGVKGRNAKGNDIKEGKLSALCAKHLELHPQDHKYILDILNQDRRDTCCESIEELKQLFKTQGSLKLCLDFIQQKLIDIQNNNLLQTNTRLSEYFKSIVNQLMNNFDEVNL